MIEAHASIDIIADAFIRFTRVVQTTFFIAMSIGQDIKGTILSYGDDFVYTFSTNLEDTSIERTFVKQLAADGVKVSVTTNGVFYG